jgi:uncharacterized protein YdhG (YjbR/CyaY superfamily)
LHAEIGEQGFDQSSESPALTSRMLRPIRRAMGRSKTVDAWFARYENPMKDVVLRMREIILAADPRMEECIKWQAPTFTFGGNLASFFPKSKRHVSLMFHTGAQIPGTHPRLEGTGDSSRVMKIGSVAEANKAKAEIEAIVLAWCDSRGTATKTAKVAKKNPAAKRNARR